VYITGSGGSAEAAEARIKALTRIFKVGEQLDVEITRVVDFGAFAKLNDQHEGLIHISEIAPFRIEKMDGVLSVGEKVPVTVSKVDDGKIGLSIKQADPKFAERKGLTPPEQK
jgi:predicted RNA-binding protein with RPS1 domain